MPSAGRIPLQPRRSVRLHSFLEYVGLHPQPPPFRGRIRAQNFVVRRNQLATIDDRVSREGRARIIFFVRLCRAVFSRKGRCIDES